MKRYYQSASGALRYIESQETTPDPEGYTAITEQEYRAKMLHKQHAQALAKKLAVQQYHAQELETAKEAYDELRKLGMSDKVARAMTKYHG